MKALICGVNGQDGAYLARFLVDKGYTVFGTSRDASSCTKTNLIKLGVDSRVNLLTMVSNDFRSVLTTLQMCEPDEIYYLAGQSSVGLSFSQPVETLDSFTISVLNILESIRFLKRDVKFYNAGSSESFGDTPEEGANEDCPFKPRSPYAVAKASAHWLVSNYRESYNLFACNGVLFNHESPLRQSKFVTQKIVAGARDVANGRSSSLELGNIDVFRDWGWAPDYVEAMWLMLQQETPEDFVIASGKSHSLRQFVDLAFNAYKLKADDYVQINPDYYRPSDIQFSQGDPTKALDKLGWQSKHEIDEIIHLMTKALN